MSKRNLVSVGPAIGMVLVAGCSNATSGQTAEERATLEVKQYVADELEALASAAERLQEAAPEPDADGWSIDADRDAVEEMRDLWGETRVRYERVEGAIAVLFPHLDASTDERYDGFIAEAPDDDLFDGEGVTGMHAIERILWADSHPATVVSFEQNLDGYVAAAFPASESEAEAFKQELVQLLVEDTATMHDDFAPLALDASTAFRGVIGSMAEQLEKVGLAATAEDESRYAQRTLDDMRANLDGGRATYAAFRDWVLEAAGEETDAAIERGFEQIADAYAAIDAAAIPEPPDGFNPDEPSEEHLQTPYGVLFSLLTEQTDATREDSLISFMLEAASAMDIPDLPE